VPSTIVKAEIPSANSHGFMVASVYDTHLLPANYYDRVAMKFQYQGATLQLPLGRVKLSAFSRFQCVDSVHALQILLAKGQEPSSAKHEAEEQWRRVRRLLP
jgi:hypothetical protein